MFSAQLSLLIAAILAFSEGFSFGTRCNAIISRNRNVEMTLPGNVGNNIRKILIGAASIALVQQGSPSFADTFPVSTIEVEESMAPKPLQVISTEDAEAQRVKRKLELQRASSKEDDSYAGSLKKEQAKQDARSKKTKEEKRRDLCETLGRGC
jgi:hypothetical protein